jgi:hypothetical protein
MNDLEDQGWEALALNDYTKIQKCHESVQTNELVACSSRIGTKRIRLGSAIIT